MKSKKILVLALAAIMLLGMLAACGSPAEPTPAATEQPAATTAPPPAPTPEPNTPDPGLEGLSGEITVWDIWPNPDDTNSRAYVKAIADFEAAYPGVTIKREPYENQQYKETVFPTAAAANLLPDVFFGWGPAFARDLVAKGALEPLDSYLDTSYMSTVQSGSLDNFTFDGKVYGLTMYNWAAVFYCNQKMFDDNGIKVPATYDELMDAIAAFNDKGIVPIALPASDAWTVAFFQHILAIRFCGANDVNAMLRGEKSFNDPKIVQSAQGLLDLAAAGAFDKDCLASDYGIAQTLFCMGEIPMYYMGDWMVGSITGYMPDADGNETTDYYPAKDDVIAVNFPATGNGFDDQILGGATDGFMVNAASPNKEAAVEFVKFITAAVPEYGYQIAGAISTRSNFDPSKYSANLPSLTVQIADYASKSTGATLAWDTFLPDAPKDKMLDMLQQLVGQRLTAEEFAANMAKAMEDGGFTSY